MKMKKRYVNPDFDEFKLISNELMLTVSPGGDGGSSGGDGDIDLPLEDDGIL